MGDSSKGELALKRRLQQSFKTVQCAIDGWKTEYPNLAAILSAVLNLSEQFESCKSVSIESTPLQSHPNLKGKLLCKISTEIESKTSQLKTIIDSHETHCQQISKQRQSTMELYDKYSDQLDMDILVRRSATEPSLADMIEWLQDCDHQLSQQLNLKKHLLSSLIYDKPQTIERLQTAWVKGDAAVLEDIQRKLDLVGFFMQVDF